MIHRSRKELFKSWETTAVNLSKAIKAEIKGTDSNDN